MIRIAIVDDQELLRSGFRMILEAQDDLTVVAEAGDGVEALERLESANADVVLMDIRMPRLDGVEVTRRLGDWDDPPRVIILTTFDLDEYVFAALEHGASGFLLKDTPPNELVRAIRVVAAGDALLSPSITKRVIDRHVGPRRADPHPGLADLTDREMDVLSELARGLSNVEIGQKLFVSETTVKTHVGRVLSKLGVRDRTQAVVVAYQSGLMDGRTD